MNNLEALIECYLDICQYEKKLSQDTLKAYRTDLAQFRAFVGGAEVSRDLLSQYIKYLNNSFAPRSVKRKLASLRAFYRLMETREAISQNPFVLLRWGKLKADGRQFDGLLGIPLLEHGLMQHHLVPHAHRRQTLAEMVGLDDVRAIVFGCVIGHCLTMLNC